MIIAIVCAGVCIWLAYIAWPVKYKKGDTSKVDKEIDRLLDETEKIYDQWKTLI